MVPLWIDLALPLLNHPCKQCLSACYAVFDKENIIKWKVSQKSENFMLQKLVKWNDIS